MQEINTRGQLTNSQTDIIRLEALIHQLVERSAEKDRELQNLQKQLLVKEEKVRKYLLVSLHLQIGYLTWFLAA